MASRKLRNRSYFVVSQAESNHSESMENNNVTCVESDAVVTVRGNTALEQAGQSVSSITTSNEGSMSNTQLQELLSTLKQTIQSEICKQTAALEE
jgi:hypothetical protein